MRSVARGGTLNYFGDVNVAVEKYYSDLVAPSRIADAGPESASMPDTSVQRSCDDAEFKRRANFQRVQSGVAES